MSVSSPRRSPSPRPFDTSHPNMNYPQHYYAKNQQQYQRSPPKNKQLSNISAARGRLQRQFSTTKNEQDQVRRTYPPHVSRSCESAQQHHVQFQEQEEEYGAHYRNNSYPKQHRSRRGHTAQTDGSAQGTSSSSPYGQKRESIADGSARGAALNKPYSLEGAMSNSPYHQRRQRPRPPPLNFSSSQWDSGQTSETDCSVASSLSPTRSSRNSSPIHSSPSPSQSGQQTSSTHNHNMALSPGPSPRHESRSPRGTTYFSLPPLSPIPHSPQPSVTPTNMVRHSSPIRGPLPRTPPAPGSSPRSPCSPFSPGPYYNQNCQSPGSYRSPSPGPSGNLARLAHRRRSNAVFGLRTRRTSNFLELPGTF